MSTCTLNEYERVNEMNMTTLRVFLCLITIIQLSVSDVVASNRISWVKTSLNITVLLPLPQNLSVSVVMEHAELPWCRLGDAWSEHHVYSKVPMQFEAFLPVNADLMFRWKVVENSTGRTDGEVTVAGVPCYQGQPCTSSVQVGLPLCGRLFAVHHLRIIL